MSNLKMKHLFFIFLFLSINSLFSQDTLIHVNGEKQTVKVTEVNSTLIKYHKYENITGPLYSVEKKDIKYVKYFGGQIDSFAVVESPGVIVVLPKPKNELTYFGSKVFYNSNSINEKEFLSMINAYPEENARMKMQHSYRQMMAHKDIATASLACGLVLGCAVVIATAPFVTGLTDGYAIPSEEGMQVAVIGILSGAAMRITAFAVSQSQRNKRKAKIREIVSIYNGDYTFK
jgi:hypothetical protein